VATDCDVMLVIGTSAVVQPAALMPVVAKDSGAKVIEINPERTPLTGDVSDYFIKGTAGDVMNRIIADLEKMV
jgi:NAD-dependent deacetylase